MEPKLENEVKKWTDNVLIKSAIIGLLILVLMIPGLMINDLVRERAYRKTEVNAEVSSKWGQVQTLTGPYIEIPYLEELKYSDNRPSDWREQKLYYFPHTLDLEGIMTPVVKKRSIFKVILYESAIRINGTFHYPDLGAFKLTPELILWDKAVLHFALTDISGIAAQVECTVGDTLLPMTAAVPSALNLQGGLACPLPGALVEKGPFDFQIQLKAKGSQGLYFSPVAGNNTLKIISSWPSPKFEGQFLPDSSKVTGDGFEAHWRILDINRQIARQWTGVHPQVFQHAVGSKRYPEPYVRDTGAAPLYGVELLDTVDHYAKNQRTVKYAFLLVTLTFVVYFFCEILKKQRVHPLQYGLVGAALVIFFILLLSLSEHLGFDPAYIISSGATILLISLYSRSIFAEKKYAGVVGGFLVLLFGFIYTILQLEDYALLAGSIALFLIVALLMYLTRKVKW